MTYVLMRSSSLGSDRTAMYAWHPNRKKNVKASAASAELQSETYAPGPVFSYKLRYIVGFWLVEMAISTNQKPTIYRNLYENTGPVPILTLFVCWESRISRTLHMTYEASHTIPSWDRHEAKCDTDDPNRTILGIRTIGGPAGRTVCIKRDENSRIRHSEHHHHLVHPASPYKKYAKKGSIKREDKTTQKHTPPDYDSEGNNIEVTQSIQQQKEAMFQAQAPYSCSFWWK